MGNTLETDTYDALGRRITEEDFDSAAPAVSDGGFELPSLGTDTLATSSTGRWARLGPTPATPPSPATAATYLRQSQRPRGDPGGRPADDRLDQPGHRRDAGRHLRADLRCDAKRADFQASVQDFQVLVDSNVVGTFTPSGIDYAGYATDVFTVTAGVHTITFQALDSAGGDNTAFIDGIQLTQETGAGLSDGGFESPSLGTDTPGNFQYGPVGTPWSYTGLAAVAGNGSAFTSGNPNAPEGTQVGVLQTTGSITQVVDEMAAGTYELTFDAAQRANFQASVQNFQVLVDSNVVGTFTPSGITYAGYATDAFTVTAGAHDHLPVARLRRRRQHRLPR